MTNYKRRNSKGCKCKGKEKKKKKKKKRGCILSSPNFKMY
jgi:hypothetical protein